MDKVTFPGSPVPIGALFTRETGTTSLVVAVKKASSAFIRSSGVKFFCSTISPDFFGQNQNSFSGYSI